MAFGSFAISRSLVVGLVWPVCFKLPFSSTNYSAKLGTKFTKMKGRKKQIRLNLLKILSWTRWTIYDYFPAAKLPPFALSFWWSAALYIPCKDSRTIQRSLQGCSWHYAVVIIWNNFLSTCLFFSCVFAWGNTLV